MQLQAGYIIESIKDELIKSDKIDRVKLESLYNSLCFFDIESENDIEDVSSELIPQLGIINNIISRGLPTRLPLDSERLILSLYGKGNYETELGTIKNILTDIDEDFLEKLYQSLHVIDHKVNYLTAKKEYEESWEKLGSEYEENFLFDIIPNEFPNGLGDLLIQLIEQQRSLQSIIGDLEYPDTLQNNFQDQKVDFSIEFPYPLGPDQKKGIIIEVDGSQHNLQPQSDLDKQRDKATIKAGWYDTIRVKTNNWNNLSNTLEPLRNILKDDYFNQLFSNYTKPLSKHTSGLEALHLMLTPFSIARIQKTLIELFVRGIIDINAEELNIAVIERDIPGAFLAIKSLNDLVYHLNMISSEAMDFPKINLTVFTSNEYLESRMQDLTECRLEFIEDISKDNILYDLVLDNSILGRKGFLANYKFPITPKKYIKISSAKSIKSKRQITTTELVKYKSLVTDKGNNEFEDIKNSKGHLTFFLQNIFRKEKFKPGQLPILDRALKLQSLIGILPTGAGKSLTYQLASFLQPGLTIIIDPIKSLMQDQVEGLQRNYIDTQVFINSSVKGDDRKHAKKKIVNGEILFTFISPERMQMEDFRGLLRSLNSKGIYFAYGVIDEVHCVSEWGHDFRTSYLSLGRNLVEHCIPKNFTSLPLIGLTATASFDVLSDVQRELAASIDNDMLSEDAIIKIESINRHELQYEIHNIEFSKNEFPDPNNYSTKSKYEWEIKALVGKKKQQHLNDFLNELPESLKKYNSNRDLVIDEDEQAEDIERIFELIKLEDIDSNNFFNTSCTNAGLIFCPHRGWYLGVTDRYKGNGDSNGVFDNLDKDNGVVAQTFIGSDNDDAKTQQRIDEDNIKHQTEFINNKSNLLVCTKAFGMGIDKPNIRFSIHFNQPSSIESFVQESGRIGRDGKLAVSYLLLNDTQFQFNNETIDIDQEILFYFYNNSFKGQKKELAILNEVLNEINYPKINNVDLLNNYLNSNFSEEISCSLWKSRRTGRYYLFVSKSFHEKYGTIHLPSLKLDYSKSTESKTISIKLLNAVEKYILTNKPINVDPTNWLLKKIPTENQPGILPLLERLSVGEPFEIIVGFTNDLEEIVKGVSELLCINVHAFFSLDVITESFNSSFVDFVSDIEEKYFYRYNTHISIEEKLNEKDIKLSELENLYNQYRVKSDTEKALYRLSIMGVIDDYTIDYNSNTYHLYGEKKSEKEYYSNLRRYVRKYYSEVRTSDIMETIVSAGKGGAIQNGIKHIVDFVYSEIAFKQDKLSEL